MSTTLGWGIIGCGDVVFHKSGPSIVQAGRSRIVGVMRRDPTQAQPFAAEHGIALCTDDADAVIAHSDVDIVYIATPPVAHKPFVLAAAEAGKHVLVEKPMGMSAAQDEEMIDACRRAGVELFVAYYRRFHPHAVKMKQLIDEGRIGQPVMAMIDYAQPPAPGTAWGGGWRVQPEISGGGLFVDVGSHRTDLMIHLLGEPRDVQGLAAKEGEVEQIVTANMRFGDALCSVCGDFVSGRQADRFVIAGTEGVIDAAQLDSHTFAVTSAGRTETLTFERDAAPHLGLIRHIERVLAGRETNASSGASGRMTDVVLDQVLQRGA